MNHASVAVGFRLPRLRRLSWFLVAFAVLQVLDMATTLLLLSIGGIELNPIAAWSLQHGTLAFVVLKLGLAALLLAFVPLMERERGEVRAATWTCASLDVLFGAAVTSNAVQVALFA